MTQAHRDAAIKCMQGRVGLPASPELVNAIASDLAREIGQKTAALYQPNGMVRVLLGDGSVLTIAGLRPPKP